MGSRTAVLALGVLSVSLLDGAELSKYRGFRFGMDVMAAAKQPGTKGTELRVVHQRPALIQEMDWEPRAYGLGRSGDPLKAGLLTFYKDELFRIVVNYESDKVEGMTPADMIAAISAIYGLASQPEENIAFHSNYAETASVLARWEDSEYSFNLVRSGYGDSFAMVMYSKPLTDLAAAAISESVRLDAAEATEREIQAQGKQQEAERLTLEKARSVNAPNFRP